MDDNQSSTSDIIAQSQKKLFYTILLVSIVLLGKLIGGFATNSLALFSDSWHLVTDLVTLIISWFGVRISAKAASCKYTFGYYRYSVLTALINNISLILISLIILYKAVVRYFNPMIVEPGGMVFFSILGIVVNTVIIRYLGSDSKNANVKSVFLHFVGDALSDFGVLIGGIIIYFTGWHSIDTLLSAILACLILKSAIKMALECIKILLEAVPNGLSVTELKRALLSISGIVDVRDIHVWSLSMEAMCMTAHLCLTAGDFDGQEAILHQVQHLLKERFNIEHSTLQVEHLPCSSCFHSKPDHIGSCTMCIDCASYRLKNRHKKSLIV